MNLKLKPRVLLDANSLLWPALFAGTDAENGRKVLTEDGRKVQVNGAEHGFWNAVTMVSDVLKVCHAVPRELVVVYDGEQSKLYRQQILPEYKAHRGGGKPDELIVEFDKLRQLFDRALLDLGAIVVTQPNVEADDILGYLAKKLRGGVTVVSWDGDLAVLSDPLGGINTLIRGEMNGNPFGPWPCRAITAYKALCGDSSDGYKGVPRFGPKAFEKLWIKFGDDGLDALTEILRDGDISTLAEDVGAVAELKYVVENAEAARTCFNLADLHLHRVDTPRRPLQWKPGLVREFDPEHHPEPWKHWYGTRTLVHAGNLPQVAAEIAKRWERTRFSALDIETDTPAESKEWIARRKAAASDEDRVGVDVVGSYLVSMGLTLGDNAQHTYYTTTAHKPEPGVQNVTSDEVAALLQAKPAGVPLVIQNLSFELSVLQRAWGHLPQFARWHGMLPDVEDTKLMASYVNENISTGLKQCSKHWLGYEQVSYAECVGERSGMAELTAHEAFAYGADDPICTAALYNFYSLVMHVEGSYDVYREVDIDAAYMDADRMNKGCRVSIEHMNQLQRDDDATYEAAWKLLREDLIARGWEGTVCPEFTDAPLTAADIKHAHLIVTGEELKTQVRTPQKLAALIEQNNPLLASCIRAHLEGRPEDLCNLVKLHFKGEPEVNFDSPKQVADLLYKTWGLPVRLRNRPTPDMRKRGEEGSPRTDSLALDFARVYDLERTDLMPLVQALQAVKIIQTKRKLYYRPYPLLVHWSDGRFHSQVNQNQAVTRRSSSSAPNLQQIPKHPKSTGEPARLREIFVPHHRRAVIVSLDYNAQELRQIAEFSQDANMLSCYVGENKKDMHSLTAAGIVPKKTPQQLFEYMGVFAPTQEQLDALAAAFAEGHYEGVVNLVNDEQHALHKIAKVLRALGKKTNFTTEYGAQRAKVAETLIVTEDEAQVYIEAKYAAFPRAEQWKKEVIEEAYETGYATTMMGARRRLPDLMSDNKWEARRCERQAVNFKIQGSSGEQTKLGMGRIWRRGTLQRYDIEFIGPIHDELVFSIGIDCLIPALSEIHAEMTRPYSTMKVPVVSSISIGRNFGEQHEVGEEVDPVRIKEVLRSLFEEAVQAA